MLVRRPSLPHSDVSEKADAARNAKFLLGGRNQASLASKGSLLSEIRTKAPPVPAGKPAILTVTLNPALDLATSVEKVVPGPKLRCSEPMTDPGGGGINVSRAIHNLGGYSRAFVALGGPLGEMLATMLAKVGIETAQFDAPGDTRLSFAVTETRSGGQYRFMLPGPVWSAPDVTRVLAAIAAAVPHSGFVVLSGSQPPGVPEDFAARLSRALATTRARLVVDTSGAPLRALVASAVRPYLLRLDGLEAEYLAGRLLPDRAASLDFAAELVGRGAAEVVVLARGVEGSVLVSHDQRLFSPAAKVTVVSKIGAGDSFMAALVLALARGEGLAAAMQWGTAAASAAVTSRGTGLCRRADVERLLEECRVTGH